jgi:uncharacterized membrane protein (DUF2068 family)
VLLAAGAAAYSLVRFFEAYGLFHQRAWAEVLAAASGAIYVPFELDELVRRPNSLAIIGINVVIVAVMIRALMQRRQARHAA